jgi:hypothetical protein
MDRTLSYDCRCGLCLHFGVLTPYRQNDDRVTRYVE